MPKKIILNFGDFELQAKLFDTIIAQRFYRDLPYTIDLTTWGGEAYGSIGLDLGTENPIPKIPAGGLAYTNQGNYLCIFYGQTPAWAVEHIGNIVGDEWKTLRGKRISSLKLSKGGD